MPELLSSLIKKVADMERAMASMEKALQQHIEKPTQQQETPYNLTVNDIMKMYGVGRTNVYKWFKQGLRVTKMGRKTFVKPHHLEEFEKRNNQLTRLKKSA
jgi:translation elongation factor EF-Tu-like GTPase